MDLNIFLQTSFKTKLEHCTFSSSKGKVRTGTAIVLSAPNFLSIFIADSFHGSTLRA